MCSQLAFYEFWLNKMLKKYYEVIHLKYSECFVGNCDLFIYLLFYIRILQKPCISSGVFITLVNCIYPKEG